MDTLKIGIVGCGEVTQILHLPSLVLLKEKFTVIALCDVSRTVLEQVGRKWGIKQLYTDYEDMMNLSEIDIILIANPNVYHAKVAIKAIRAGKHILIEKPMCITIEEADELEAERKKKGVIVQVGYMRRYAPAFKEALKNVSEMKNIRLARVHAVIGSNNFFIKNISRVIKGEDIPESLKNELNQFNDEKIRKAIGSVSPEINKAYNLLLGLSSHDISVMRELLGYPKKVLYASQRSSGNYLTAAFDYGDFICHFETGIDEIPRFDSHIEVFSEDKVLKLQYNTPYIRNLPTTLHIIESNKNNGIREIEETLSFGDNFVAEWNSFYHCIRNMEIPKTSIMDFRQDLLLFRDIIEKMKNN